MMRLPITFLSGAFVAAAAMAAEAPPPGPPPAPAATTPASLGFAKVDEALRSLRARDGDGTVVTESDGWVIINEPLAGAQWSFTPATHEAYPAVVRRIVRRGSGGAVQVETAKLCEAPAAACEKLQAEFDALNDRITQAVRARARQGSTPPAPVR